MRVARRSLFCALAFAAPARAAWPERPLRLLVPFPAGGATDFTARLLGERLGARLGQSVLVDNRGGAGGIIAAEMATRLEPDGHGLLLASIGTAAIIPNLHQRLSFRPEDLLPVAPFAELPNVIVVGPDSPHRTLAELLAAARARPGALSYASSGTGSSLHLSGEMLRAMAGVDIVHVPFRGGADSVNQIIAGRVEMGFNNLPSAIAMIRAGQLRALAVTSAVRSPAIPDIPTVQEAGILGYEATAWFGVQVPRGTPRATIERLNAEIGAVAEEPETRARAERVGARLVTGTVEEFASFIAMESAKWREVIRVSGATPD